MKRIITLVCLASLVNIADCSHQQRKHDKQSSIDKKLSDLKHCLSVLESDGQLIDAFSQPKDYEIVNHQWNLRKKKVFPFAYFLPSSTSDVQNIVRCGRWMGIHVVPNSGGHSFEALSFGNNQSLIIDFRLMNNVRLLEDGISAIIQPGTLMSHLYSQLWMQGKRGTPGAMCLSVGFGGFLIGGGIGFGDSVYGVAADNLIEIEIVMANGEIVVATEKNNADLFWAFRGVGPGLIGIVTGYKIRTFDAENIKITIALIEYPLEEFIDSINALQSWYNWADVHEPNVFINYEARRQTQGATISIYLYHIEDSEHNPRNNINFIKGVEQIFGQNFPTPTEIKYIFPSYLQLFFTGNFNSPVNFLLSNGTIVTIRSLADPILDEDLKYAFPQPIISISGTEFNANSNFEKAALRRLLSLKKEISSERFSKTKTLFVSRDITEGELDKMNTVVQRIPLNQGSMLLNSWNGQIASRRRTETAFVHRTEHFGFSISVNSPLELGCTESAMNWLYELWDKMQSFDSGQSYQNYVDLDQKDHFDRHYKENFPRLVQCKAKWDPNNYFNWTYSLPLVV